MCFAQNAHLWPTHIQMYHQGTAYGSREMLRTKQRGRRAADGTRRTPHRLSKSLTKSRPELKFRRDKNDSFRKQGYRKLSERYGDSTDENSFRNIEYLFKHLGVQGSFTPVGARGGFVGTQP